jgi:hypothetical protein
LIYCIACGLVRIAELSKAHEERFERFARVHSAENLVRCHADAEQGVAGELESVRNVQRFSDRQRADRKPRAVTFSVLRHVPTE